MYPHLRSTYVQVIFILFLMQSYTATSDVCQYDYFSYPHCTQNPDGLISLLDKSVSDIGYMIRCQYAEDMFTCLDMEPETCVWDQGACHIKSSYLVDTLANCTDMSQWENLPYGIEKENIQCELGLQNVSANSEWIDRKRVDSVASCKLAYAHFFFSYRESQAQCNFFHDLQNEYSGVYHKGIYSSYTIGKEFVADVLYVMKNDTGYINPLNSTKLEVMLNLQSGILDKYNDCRLYTTRAQCTGPAGPQSATPNSGFTYTFSPYYSPRYSSRYSPSYSPIDWDSTYHHYPPSSYGTSSRTGGVNALVWVIFVPVVVFKLVLFGYVGIRRMGQQALRMSQQAQPAQVRVVQQQGAIREIRVVEFPTRQSNNSSSRQQPNTQETQALINQLTNTDYQEDESNSSPESCSICLESFVTGDKTTFLVCAHQFHLRCVKKWIKTKGNDVCCPLCNLKLSSAPLV
eukprot:TRINITY_DN3482_c0_g1_i1.p1 TRINITY_DN3482_c0_g1~~TRINITY_DN3482_c0_g1_i1.p1  ORF type:complete len:515 (+),score=2.60 TRINITY_DN3482_c0_g1_i1:169-1545(+)